MLKKNAEKDRILGIFGVGNVEPKTKCGFYHFIKPSTYFETAFTEYPEIRE